MTHQASKELTVDLVDFGVSHQLLHWVLAVEAGSAEDLHGVGCTAEGKSIRLVELREVSSTGRHCVFNGNFPLNPHNKLSKTFNKHHQDCRDTNHLLAASAA